MHPWGCPLWGLYVSRFESDSNDTERASQGGHLVPLETQLVLWDKNVKVIHLVGFVTAPVPYSVTDAKPPSPVLTKVAKKQTHSPPSDAPTNFTGTCPIPKG